jgi:hypothetical protein
MNDIVYFVVPIVVIAICAGVWNLVRELFVRWANNDWCRHDWDMWSGIDKESGYQYRFCRKCNKGERRIP